ncbi:MAG: hypothetical protein ACREJN_15810 [Nitrospiraceae bacterium]
MDARSESITVALVLFYSIGLRGKSKNKTGLAWSPLLTEPPTVKRWSFDVRSGDQARPLRR